jgi:tetratricopeptide (TPR) repeat protein
MQARLYQSLGWQSRTMGNYALALSRLEKGRALAEQCSDTQSLSWIHETLGETYYALGEWDRAIDDFKVSLNYAEQAGERRATSRVYSTLGDIYRNQGNWTEADECYQHALAAISSTGAPQSLFVVNLSLGLVNMERQRYAKAKEFFDKCWAITSQGVGFASRMATTKTAMGELAIRTGEIGEAQQHIEEAIRLAQEADAQQELAHATMVKGIIATHTGDWDQALSLLDQAKGVLEQLGDKHSLGRVHAELGAMYVRRDGGPEDRTQAQEHISTARTIFTELGAKKDLEELPTILGIGGL